jgi:hypothetical protein
MSRTTPSVLAPELFATAHGVKSVGAEQCHWCGTACDRSCLHDDTPPIAFHKLTSSARYYSGNWICAGCQQWRHKRHTVFFQDRTYRDCVSPQNYSWWIEETEAFALRTPDLKFYQKLLQPPLTFCLSLSDGSVPHLLHTSLVNQHVEIAADSKLRFTFNNIPQYYTVYELEEALKTTEKGKTPGVQLLIRLFGRPILKLEEALVPEVKDAVRGRPKKDFDKAVQRATQGTPLTRKVAMSGG